MSCGTETTPLRIYHVALLDSVSQELENQHLPLLEQTDLLTYNREEELVQLAASLTAIQAQLQEGKSDNA